MTSTSKFDAQRATDCCNIYEKTYRFVISFQQSLMCVVAHIYKDFLVLKKLVPTNRSHASSPTLLDPPEFVSRSENQRQTLLTAGSLWTQNSYFYQHIIIELKRKNIRRDGKSTEKFPEKKKKAAEDFKAAAQIKLRRREIPQNLCLTRCILSIDRYTFDVGERGKLAKTMWKSYWWGSRCDVRTTPPIFIFRPPRLFRFISWMKKIKDFSALAHAVVHTEYLAEFATGPDVGIRGETRKIFLDICDEKKIHQ